MIKILDGILTLQANGLLVWMPSEVNITRTTDLGVASKVKGYCKAIIIVRAGPDINAKIEELSATQQLSL